MKTQQTIYMVVHVTRGVLGVSIHNIYDAARNVGGNVDGVVLGELQDAVRGGAMPPGFRFSGIEVDTMDAYTKGTA